MLDDKDWEAKEEREVSRRIVAGLAGGGAASWQRRRQLQASTLPTMPSSASASAAAPNNEASVGRTRSPTLRSRTKIVLKNGAGRG